MTITNVSAAQEFDGNGTTTALPVTFVFFAGGASPEIYPDVRVYKRNKTTGTVVLLTYTTDYAISSFTGSGTTVQGTGTIDMVVAPTALEEIHVIRSTGFDQTLDFVSAGRFPSVDHEGGLDKAAMRAADMNEMLSRSLVLPRSDPNSPILPNSVDRASKLLAFGVSGELIVSSESIPAATSSFMSPVLQAATEGAARTLLEIDEEPNMIYNSCGEVIQRPELIGSQAELVYVSDGWKLVSNGNARLNHDGTIAGPNGLSADSVSLSTNERVKTSAFQVIENALAAQIVASGGVEISFWARQISGVANDVDFYFLQWTGTGDAPDADPVTTWPVGDDKPTFTASWGGSSPLLRQSKISIPAVDTWYKFTYSISGGISSATNFGFMFGAIDKTPTATESLLLSLACVQPSGGSTFHRQRPFAEDLRRSQRFYWKTFPYTTLVLDNRGHNGALNTMASAGNPNFIFNVRNPVPMIQGKTPTYTIYNPDTDGASANGEIVNVTHSSGTDSSTAGTIHNATELGCAIKSTSNDTADNNDQMALHLTAKVEL